MSDLRYRRLRLAALSLALACCAWFYVTWEREERKTLRLPVRTANASAGLAASGLPAEVEVVLAGPRLLLADPGLQRMEVVLDLAGAGEGEVSFPSLDRLVGVGSDLRVVRTAPARVDVRLVRGIEQKGETAK